VPSVLSAFEKMEGISVEQGVWKGLLGPEGVFSTGTYVDSPGTQ